MNCIIRIASIILLLITSMHQSDAQQSSLDSLQLRLQQKSITSDEKLKILDDLSWEYLSIDFTKSCSFAREGIKLAHLKDNLVMEATLTRNLGVAYYMDNRLDSAEIILINALKIAKKSSESSLVAGVYSALGNTYNVQNRYDMAIEHYNKAMPIYEALGRMDKVYTIQANIGTLYYNRHNYPQAEKYLLAAQQLAIEAEDIPIQGQIAQNLSNIYFATSMPEKAYYWAEKAVSLCREAADEYNEVLALTSLSGACQVHLKDNSLAMKYAIEALNKARKIDMPNLISASLCNMAYLYYRNGDYQQALKNAKESVSLTDSTDLEQLIGMHSTMLESYIQLNDKINAEKSFHKVYELMTHQSDEEVSHALAEMEIQYETQKKENAINTLSHEKQLLWTITVVLIAAVILLVIALILFNSYQRQKRLRADEKISSFETQKQLLAAEWLLNGENKERSRISRELHDGLGGLLTIAKIKLSQLNLPNNVLLLIDNAITEMRRISSNLMPEMLGRFGLRATLSEYCKVAPIIDLHFYGEDQRYDSTIEINIYRIACELINNALKHSEATQINVQLITERERISLIVQDNGKGFDFSKVSGNGLNNIRNRSSIMHATLDIFSKKGMGTEITIDLKTAIQP